MGGTKQTCETRMMKSQMTRIHLPGWSKAMVTLRLFKDSASLLRDDDDDNDDDEDDDDDDDDASHAIA